jgi:hypothetical protein
MKIKPLPPVKYLEECFVCDYEAGILTWKARPREHFKTARAWKIWNTRFAGKPAGSLDLSGYLLTRINGKEHRNHRIAWKMATGLDPVAEIDHINGIKADNRLCNLREATKGENGCNRHAQRNSLIQIKGISKTPSGKFSAKAAKKARYIG